MHGRGTPGGLERRVAGVGAVAAVALLAGHVVLSAHLGRVERWTATATIVAGAAVAVAWRHRDENRPPEGGRRRERLGAGNLATLARGVLLGAVAGFAAVSWTDTALAWAPAACYGLAAALDYADGALARHTGRESRLGARLDAEFDALGVVAATAVGVTAGQVPVWFCAVGAAKYVYVAARRLRRWRGRPVYPLAGRASRRVLAGLQMAFLAAALTPAIAPEGAYAVAPLVGLPYLLGFLRDWGQASGRLPAAPTPPGPRGRPGG